MTIRDLKNFLNSVNEKYLDENILFCYEEPDGYGTVLDTNPVLTIDEWNNFCFVVLNKETKENFYKNPTLWIDKDIEI
jgi:hypothetical protein